MFLPIVLQHLRIRLLFHVNLHTISLLQINFLQILFIWTFFLKIKPHIFPLLLLLIPKFITISLSPLLLRLHLSLLFQKLYLLLLIFRFLHLNLIFTPGMKPWLLFFVQMDLLGTFWTSLTSIGQIVFLSPCQFFLSVRRPMILLISIAGGTQITSPNMLLHLAWDLCLVLFCLLLLLWHVLRYRYIKCWCNTMGLAVTLTALTLPTHYSLLYVSMVEFRITLPNGG